MLGQRASDVHHPFSPSSSPSRKQVHVIYLSINTMAVLDLVCVSDERCWMTYGESSVVSRQSVQVLLCLGRSVRLSRVRVGVGVVDTKVSHRRKLLISIVAS